MNDAARYRTVFFLSVAAILFAIVALGLGTGKTLGIAFRGRFIARRQHEPRLYWASLAIFALFGLVLIVGVVNVRLQSA
jgi:hypothetical protein